MDSIVFSIRLRADLKGRVDRARGSTSRNAWITEAIEAKLKQPSEPSGEDRKAALRAEAQRRMEADRARLGR